MRILRRILAILIVLFAISGIIMNVSLSSWSFSYAWNSAAENRETEMLLQKANIYVDSYEKKAGYLPSSEEFHQWVKTQPGMEVISYDASGHSKTMVLIPGNFSDTVMKKFGRPVGNAYLLKSSNGYWDNFYASWAGRTNIDPREFSPWNNYLMREELRGLILHLLFTGLLFLIAVFIWPRRKKKGISTDDNDNHINSISI
jgi:hypothetical protein